VHTEVTLLPGDGILRAWQFLCLARKWCWKDTRYVAGTFGDPIVENEVSTHTSSCDIVSEATNTPSAGTGS
jgi:hypothetical protein